METASNPTDIQLQPPGTTKKRSQSLQPRWILEMAALGSEPPQLQEIPARDLRSEEMPCCWTERNTESVLWQSRSKIWQKTRIRPCKGLCLYEGLFLYSHRRIKLVVMGNNQITCCKDDLGSQAQWYVTIMSDPGQERQEDQELKFITTSSEFNAGSQ